MTYSKGLIKYIAAFVFIFLCLLTTPQFSIADTTIYGANAYGFIDMVEINLTQETSQQVGNLAFETQAIDQDPETGYVYYFEWRATSDEFAYWDPATGTNTVVRTYDPAPGIQAKQMAFAPNGVLYLITNQDDLYSIDKDTGDLFWLGQVVGLETGSYGRTGDMAFSPDGRLYVFTYASLYIVDIETLMATLLYTDMLEGEGLMVWTGAAYCNGLLYASNAEQLTGLSAIFSIDPDSGEVNRLFYIQTFLNDLSSCPAGIPPLNQPPELDPIGAKTVEEGVLLEFTVTATDPDGDNLAYTADNLPSGATFVSATQVFSWTPDYGQTGVYPNVLFTVTDDGNPPLSDSQAITITVGDVNRPPALDPIGDRSVAEGEALIFTVTASDPDGDNLTLSTGILPPGASFDSVSGVFSWTPDDGQADDYGVSFTVTDDGSPAESDNEQITITVNTSSTPLTVTLSGENYTEDTMIVDGSYSLSNFGESPENLAVGSYGITVRTLVKWDLASIPTGSTIISAEMSLYCRQDYTGGPITINTYRILQPWVEGTLQDQDRQLDDPFSSCWLEYGYGDPWDEPGANGSNDRDPSILSSTTNSGIGWYSWDLTAAFQRWVDGDWTNNGLVLVSDNENNNNLKIFATSEYQDENFRPKLVIEYILP